VFRRRSVERRADKATRGTPKRRPRKALWCCPCQLSVGGAVDHDALQCGEWVGRRPAGGLAQRARRHPEHGLGWTAATRAAAAPAK